MTKNPELYPQSPFEGAIRFRVSEASKNFQSCHWAAVSRKNKLWIKSRLVLDLKLTSLSGSLMIRIHDFHLRVRSDLAMVTNNTSTRRQWRQLRLRRLRPPCPWTILATAMTPSVGKNLCFIGAIRFEMHYATFFSAVLILRDNNDKLTKIVRSMLIWRLSCWIQRALLNKQFSSK